MPHLYSILFGFSNALTCLLQSTIFRVLGTESLRFLQILLLVSSFLNFVNCVRERFILVLIFGDWCKHIRRRHGRSELVIALLGEVRCRNISSDLSLLLGLNRLQWGPFITITSKLSILKALLILLNRHAILRVVLDRFHVLVEDGILLLNGSFFILIHFGGLFQLFLLDMLWWWLGSDCFRQLGLGCCDILLYTDDWNRDALIVGVHPSSKLLRFIKIYPWLSRFGLPLLINLIIQALLRFDLALIKFWPIGAFLLFLPVELFFNLFFFLVVGCMSFVEQFKSRGRLLAIALTWLRARSHTSVGSNDVIRVFSHLIIVRQVIWVKLLIVRVNISRWVKCLGRIGGSSLIEFTINSGCKSAIFELAPFASFLVGAIDLFLLIPGLLI